MDKTLEKRQNLYNSIKDVEDRLSRNILYRQFIDKYYPEAYNVITRFSGDE